LDLRLIISFRIHQVNGSKVARRPFRWSTTKLKQQISSYLPNNWRPKRHLCPLSPPLQHLPTSPVPSSSLTSTPLQFLSHQLAGRLVKDRGKSVADHSRCQKRQRLVTLNHRLSLLLIPSERCVSRFLFTSLHPVCLHSELKYYFRWYILFPVLNTLSLFPNCSGIIDRQVV